MGKESQPPAPWLPAEATMSGISPELSPGQMQIAALLTPSPCNLLYLAVPPHAVGIDQPTGSISRFLLRYLCSKYLSLYSAVCCAHLYLHHLSVPPQPQPSIAIWGISLQLGASPDPISAKC